MHADVAHQDGVVRQRAVDLVGGALRVDRRAVVAEARCDERVPFACDSPRWRRAMLARARRASLSVLARIELRQHLAQERAHIRHQPERDRIVARDLVGIDVDMDELRRRNGEGVARQPRARRAVVEAHAERKQHVGLRAA